MSIKRNWCNRNIYIYIYIYLIKESFFPCINLEHLHSLPLSHTLHYAHV